VDPLVIILTVPLALAGAIFGLFITQTAIGITVLVGAVVSAVKVIGTLRWLSVRLDSSPSYSMIRCR
jgi:Cu/Ag efflux pump CusA